MAAAGRAGFTGLGLYRWLADQCAVLGMDGPTPVQSAVVPRLIAGDDCIAIARTGSGKTAAFALPILNRLSEDPYGIFGVILTPTRELANQIADQVRALGQPMGLRLALVTGGMDMVQQGIVLCGKPHLIVATPGRLADHIDTGTQFSLARVRFLVLDEADRMLEDNFGQDLETIFRTVPSDRQTLLFSATLTASISTLNDVSEKKAFFWTDSPKVSTVETLDQFYLLAPFDLREAYMFQMLHDFRTESPNSSILVFTQTCRWCQLLAMMCRELGLEAVSIHSMIKQRQRLAALAKFRSAQVKILVATDVASRGLDIPTVDLVVNHQIPRRAKDYVHRVGRTARMGRRGRAVSVMSQYDVKLVESIEARIERKLQKWALDETKVVPILTEVSVARRKSEIILEEQNFGLERQINKKKREVIEGTATLEDLARVEASASSSSKRGKRNSGSADIGERGKAKH